MQNTESPAQGAFTKVPTETQKAEARLCPFVYIIPKPEQMDSERGFFFFFFFGLVLLFGVWGGGGGLPKKRLIGWH